MFYKMTAERIRNKKDMLDKLVKLASGTGFEILLAGPDPNFGDHYYIVVISGMLDHADQVQELLWNYNDGAACSIAEITDEQLDALM